MEKLIVLGKLRPFENKAVLVSNYQNSNDIINEILKAHVKYRSEYDKIAPLFWKGSVKASCKYIFNFLKKNIDYDIEPDSKQTVKSPSAFIAQGYGDCKHLSLFFAGLLDSWRRSGKNINWSYRFANYKLFNRTPHHVFVVLNPGTKKEVWCDAVLDSFNLHKPYVNSIDKNYKNMALYSISGIDEIGKIRMKNRKRMLIAALRRRLRYFQRKGWNVESNPRYKIYQKILSKLNMLSQVSGFNKNLNLESVAGIGCCGNDSEIGYTKAERQKDLNNLWRKMKEYRRNGWNKKDSPYYNEFYLVAKEYMRVRQQPTMNGFVGTTSIEGIGRRSKSERRARRKARREARRSGPNCKGRTGPKIALTLARRAYLLLVRLNFKKLGVKTYFALQNPETANKIYRKWCGLGGKASLLRSTATKAYNKAKRRGKIGQTEEAIGMVPIAVLWAQAQPVVAAISPLLALASKFLPKDSKAAEIVNTASDVTSAAQ